MSKVTRGSIRCGQSLRHNTFEDVALPHPQSRQDHQGNEHKPNLGGICRKRFKRTENITEYRDAEDDVYAANNRTFGAFLHDSFTPFTTFELPQRWGFSYLAACCTPRAVAASRRISSPRVRPFDRWEFRREADRE